MNVPVLCYHNTCASGEHDPELFGRHLDVIADLGFTPVSSLRLLDILSGKVRPTGREIVLTFDDCHLSNWTATVPMLAERGLTGTFFAVTDFIGQGEARPQDRRSDPGSLAEAFRLALSGDLSRFMNEAEIRAAAGQGMEIFPHSARHQSSFRSMRRVGEFHPGSHWGVWGIYGGYRPGAPLFEQGSAYCYDGFWPRGEGTELSFVRRSRTERLAFCLEDFGRSFQRIRELTGAAVQVFCWPWGHFDELGTEALRRTGFAGAYTLERRAVGPGADPFRIGRIGVGRGKSADWLRARLRMYATALGARVFFKHFRKRPEPGGVLYATNATWFSGGCRQMMNNVAAMVEAGAAPTVIAPDGTPVAEALRASGAAFVPLALDRVKDMAALTALLRRTLSEGRFDAVHAFHGNPVRAAVLARLTGHRFRLFVNRGVLYKPNPLYPLWSLLGGVVCNSRRCAEVMRGSLVPASRVSVIYNSLLEPGPEPAGPGPGPVQVLYVGNAGTVKGYDVFLRMAAACPAQGLRFTACGVDPAHDFSWAAPAEVLARIESPGYVSHADVAARMAAGGVYVLTSRQESMPNTVIEAMAAGMAVVATDVGGVAELVRDGVNGRLVPSGDHAALAAAVADLARDPDRTSAMGRLNRRLVLEVLNNRRKGRSLLRLYAGQQVVEPEPLSALLGDA